jgi:hypothetical protein
MLGWLKLSAGMQAHISVPPETTAKVVVTKDVKTSRTIARARRNNLRHFTGALNCKAETRRHRLLQRMPKITILRVYISQGWREDR